MVEKLIYIISEDDGTLHSIEDDRPQCPIAVGDIHEVMWSGKTRNWPKSDEIEENVRKYLVKRLSNYPQDINAFIAHKGAYSTNHPDYLVGIRVQFCRI